MWAEVGCRAWRDSCPFQTPQTNLTVYKTHYETKCCIFISKSLYIALEAFHFWALQACHKSMCCSFGSRAGVTAGSWGLTTCPGWGPLLGC